MNIELTPISATIKDDGTTDVLFSRVIKDDQGTIVVKDVVRETKPTADHSTHIDNLRSSAPAAPETPNESV